MREQSMRLGIHQDSGTPTEHRVGAAFGGWRMSPGVKKGRGFASFTVYYLL
jgi:hypothetical protein